jgi:two-component system, cell cycle response regulator DivK
MLYSNPIGTFCDVDVSSHFFQLWERISIQLVEILKLYCHKGKCNKYVAWLRIVMTWLIAEDETDIRNLLDMMCQVWGHQTMTFENGQKVWDWLDALEGGSAPQLPDLILMDIRMPGKRGTELANRMRQLSPLSSTPIVLMTAFALSEQERQEIMLADGVDQIISKPLPDFEKLGSLLHGMIASRRT